MDWCSWASARRRLISTAPCCRRGVPTALDEFQITGPNRVFVKRPSTGSNETNLVWAARARNQAPTSPSLLPSINSQSPGRRPVRVPLSDHLQIQTTITGDTVDDIREGPITLIRD